MSHFCQTCHGTGWISGGRCHCNPAPSKLVQDAQRRLSGTGARDPGRNLVREALQEREARS